MKLNTFFQESKIRISVFILISICLIIFAIISKILVFIIPILILGLIVLSERIIKNHKIFFIFLVFYGLFSKFIFYVSEGIKFNPVFIIPALYMIIYIDEIIKALMAMKTKIRIGIMIYVGIALIFTIFVNLKYITTQMISFNVMILPVFLSLLIKNIEDIKEVIVKTAPVVLIYAVLQYMGLFTVFDSFWIKANSLITYDSLYIGGNIRPFSTFASVEELGFFLMIILIMPFVFKGKRFIVLSVISFILLFVFSLRLPLLIFIVFLFYFGLKKRMYKLVIIILLILISLTVILNIIPFKEDIHTREKGIGVFVRHTLEPFRNIFKSYSLENRVKDIRININNFKSFPYGMGLNHNPRNLPHNRNIYHSESAFVMLMLSCGIIMLLFMLIILALIARKLIMKKLNSDLSFLFLSVFLLFFSHVLSFHFITPIFYYTIIRGFNDK